MQDMLTHRFVARTPTPLVLAGMTFGAVLIYRTVSLPWIIIGLVIFGLLALLRPALALLFIPLTAPWYLSPVYVPDLRAAGTVFPLHEVLLLVVLAATLGGWLFDGFRLRPASRPRGATSEAVKTFLPHGLFLIAGVVGLVIAIERGPALRDFRWMVIEPLIFYGLFLWLRGRETNYLHTIALVLVVSGVFVALLGLLQAVGVNLVPLLLSPTKSFADSVVEAGSASRVASVYGHPNNLGMFLGRVWPLAVVLALGVPGAETSGQRPAGWRFWLLWVCAIVLVAGLFVSFSRGAWLGAVAALAVLAIGWLTTASQATQQRRSTLVALILGMAALALIGGLILTLRGGVTGGSTDARLLFWRESLQLIARQPIGLGLDQFYYYHNPDFGRSLIDPSLIGTSEQYAKHPHNLIFEVWLLLTPLGLAALTWLIVIMVDRAVRVVLHAPRSTTGLLALGALAALAAALTHGLVDTFYFWPDIALTFWLLLALVDSAFQEQQGHPPV